MTNCKWTDDPNRHGFLRCVRCEKPAIKREGRTIKSTCNNPGTLPIGDWIEKTLSAIGITEERISQRGKRKCRCKDRKWSANRFGDRLIRAVRRR